MTVGTVWEVGLWNGGRRNTRLGRVVCEIVVFNVMQVGGEVLFLFLLLVLSILLRLFVGGLLLAHGQGLRR